MPQTGHDDVEGEAGDRTSLCSMLTCNSRSGAELNAFAQRGQANTSPEELPIDGDVRSKCCLQKVRIVEYLSRRLFVVVSTKESPITFTISIVKHLHQRTFLVLHWNFDNLRNARTTSDYYNQRQEYSICQKMACVVVCQCCSISQELPSIIKKTFSWWVP